MSKDVVITLGVLIPAMTVIGFTGCYLYMQYRRRRGICYGIIPCGGKKGDKLKSSDEDVNASVNQQVPPAPGQVENNHEDIGAAAAAAALGPSVAKLADRIDEIGASSGSLEEETELYSAPPTSSSVLPPEPKPETIPIGQQKPPIPTRSREYISRKCKEDKDKDMFDFDKAQTEEMARKKGE